MNIRLSHNTFSLHVWLCSCMSSIVATTLKLLYTGGLIKEYVMMGSQVQWLPVLYVEPKSISTCRADFHKKKNQTRWDSYDNTFSDYHP